MGTSRVENGKYPSVEPKQSVTRPSPIETSKRAVSNGQGYQKPMEYGLHKKAQSPKPAP